MKRFNRVMGAVIAGMMVASLNVADAKSAPKKDKAVPLYEQDRVSSLYDVNKKKPYFIYNGYFKPNSKLLLSKKFVQGINEDNISVNGQEIRKVRPQKGEAIQDVMILIKDVGYGIYVGGAINEMTLPAAPKTISKAAFKKAHQQNKLVKSASKAKADVLIFKTKKNTYYEAWFDKKGYLLYVKVL